MPMSRVRGCDQLAKRYAWRGATREAASVGEVPHSLKPPRIRFHAANGPGHLLCFCDTASPGVGRKRRRLTRYFQWDRGIGDCSWRFVLIRSHTQKKHRWFGGTCGIPINKIRRDRTREQRFIGHPNRAGTRFGSSIGRASVSGSHIRSDGASALYNPQASLPRGHSACPIPTEAALPISWLPYGTESCGFKSRPKLHAGVAQLGRAAVL